LTGGGFEGSVSEGDRVVSIEACDDLEFAALTIRSTSEVPTGVAFVGDGETYWRDVVIEAENMAWYDSGASTASESVHWWWDSELKVQSDSGTIGLVSALYASSSIHNVFASTLIAKHDSSLAAFYGAIYASGSTTTVRVQGSLLQASNARANQSAYGAFVGFASGCGPDQASLTLEGSVVEVTAHSGSGTAIGVRNCGQNVSNQGTFYKLAGNTQRRVYSVSSGGTGAINIRGVYDLGAGTNPTVMSPTWSYKGLDAFTETDCSETKCADTSQGSIAHRLIFDPICMTAGPWFDTAVQRCRGVDPSPPAPPTIPSGAAPAATCAAGELFLDTDETNDANCTTTNDNSLCLCSASNNWVQLNNN
jgi:hypothetical protein